MRVSHRDFDTLQKTIVELHEYRDLESFLRAAPHTFLKAIPAEWFGLADRRGLFGEAYQADQLLGILSADH